MQVAVKRFYRAFNILKLETTTVGEAVITDFEYQVYLVRVRVRVRVRVTPPTARSSSAGIPLAPNPNHGP